MTYFGKSNEITNSKTRSKSNPVQRYDVSGGANGTKTIPVEQTTRWRCQRCSRPKRRVGVTKTRGAMALQTQKRILQRVLLKTSAQQICKEIDGLVYVNGNFSKCNNFNNLSFVIYICEFLFARICSAKNLK